MASLIRRRFFCTSTKKWAVKEVTKSNFAESVKEFKGHVEVSSYLKAKYAAERFQLLQFATCPFTLETPSSLLTHELRLGMPSYSFSVQTSHLTSMAEQGFDFNTCIYDGISYLSKAQESVANLRRGAPTPADCAMDSSLTRTVADNIFVERIKARVKHWKNASKKSSTKKDDDILSSIIKLVLGSELYGSRSCMNIDVCSECQVQLALEMLKEFSDELVPLIITANGGGPQSVRVVLTNSKEDKDSFERELQIIGDEQSKRVRGFQEVIDLISASQKPVVFHNSLNGPSLLMI